LKADGRRALHDAAGRAGRSRGSRSKARGAATRWWRRAAAQGIAKVVRTWDRTAAPVLASAGAQDAASCSIACTARRAHRSVSREPLTRRAVRIRALPRDFTALPTRLTGWHVGRLVADRCTSSRVAPCARNASRSAGSIPRSRAVGAGSPRNSMLAVPPRRPVPELALLSSVRHVRYFVVALKRPRRGSRLRRLSPPARAARGGSRLLVDFLRGSDDISG